VSEVTVGVPSRDELAAQLVESRIAGPIATSRENNLANYRRMAHRDPAYLFGLGPRGQWDFDDVLALMAARSGVSADPAYLAGPDTIDPELTLSRLDAFADVVGEAAASKARVLVATGHPTGLLVVHLEVARLLREAGAVMITRPAAWLHRGRDGERSPRHVRDILGVAVASQGANLLHTHSPQPMQLMLAAIEADGEPPPDLVIADHGYAGAAGRAGVTTIGYADSNDPALFVGEAEGDVRVTVPLDDNVAPQLYRPMTAYLLARAAG
jgi:Phosphatase